MRTQLIFGIIGLVAVGVLIWFGVSLTQQVDDLSNRLSAVESGMGTLAETTDRVNSSMRELRTAQTELQDAISSLRNDLSANRSRLASLEGRLQTPSQQAQRKGPSEPELAASGLPRRGQTTKAAVADFNDDGVLDLYIANGYNTDADNVYALGVGDGSFNVVALAEYGLPGGGASTGVTAADFDRDGDMDLYVSNSIGQDNRYLRNDGEGRFEKAALDEVGLPGGGFTNGSAVAADFDADGDLDLFVPNSETSVYATNNGDGTFTSVALDEAGIPSDATAVAAAAADFNRDGRLDLYVANGIRAQSGQPIEEDDAVLFNEGDGTFARQDLTEIGVPEGGTSSAVVAEDFNGDGTVDLFVARADPYRENALALNNGDGTFTSVSPGDAGLRLGSGVMSYGATAGDIDRDGDLDLVIANGGVSGRQNNTVAFNNGDGTFEIRGVEDLGLPGRGSSMDAVLADFNRDAVLDLLLTDVNAVSDPIYALGQADGSFRVVEP